MSLIRRIKKRRIGFWKQPDKLQEIYSRNLREYGDKLGPSIEWLRARGKSWEQIIQSAIRPGGKDLGF
jgi:hypothetical protein